MNRRLVVIVAVALVPIAIVVAALVVGGSTITPAQATRTWAANNEFAQSVTDLVTDSRTVQKAIAEHASSIRNDCLYLYQDSGGEYTDLLPSPDAQLTKLLDAAYLGFAQAATTCDLHTSSRADLSAVAQQCDVAFGELVAGVVREEAVTGRSLGVAGLP